MYIRYHPFVHAAILKVVHQLSQKPAAWRDFLVASHGNGLTFQWRCILDSVNHSWREWLKDVRTQESSLLATIWISVSRHFEGNPKKMYCTSKRIPRHSQTLEVSIMSTRRGVRIWEKDSQKKGGCDSKMGTSFNGSWNSLDRKPQNPQLPSTTKHRKHHQSKKNTGALRPKKSVMRLLLRWGLQ